MTSPKSKARKQKRRKVPPAVTKRELEFLARLRRDLYRIEEKNRALRKRLGLPNE